MMTGEISTQSAEMTKNRYQNKVSGVSELRTDTCGKVLERSIYGDKTAEEEVKYEEIKKTNNVFYWL